MTFLSTLKAFFQAITQYYTLKNKTAYFDLLETFDKRLDKLDNQRQIARSKATQEAQAEAETLLAEIIEEKKKLAEIKKEFSKV
jgi:DNA-binding transcriptional regulator YbjK